MLNDIVPIYRKLAGGNVASFIILNLTVAEY